MAVVFQSSADARSIVLPEGVPLTITGANKEHRVYRADCGKVDAIVAVVESRPLSISVQTYSTLSELGARTNGESADLVVLSLLEASSEACASALKDLPEFASGHPVIALASTNDPGLAFAAIHCGAKGFIPVTMGFEIAIEVMRFILAGGTYMSRPTVCSRRTRSACQRRQPLHGSTCSPAVNSQSCRRSSKANRTRSLPTS